MTLRAIVIGTGWAGEGHTLAMQNAGVEVVALCGRTLEATQKRAAQLGIKEICFDWRAALEEFLPDIVSIATPGGPHCEMALAAAGLGCHVFCEKPLAINVEQARMMLQAVERARVKHAYGSTSRYGPGVEFARSLVSSGSIGQIHEIECIFRVFPPPSVLSQYTWVNDLDQGGGVFNNGYTHMLGQMLYMTGAKVLAAAGETHTLDDRLSVGTPSTIFEKGSWLIRRKRTSMNGAR